MSLTINANSNTSDNKNVTVLDFLVERITNHYKQDRSRAPESPHTYVQVPKTLHLNQHVEIGPRGGVTDNRTHRGHLFYPVTQPVHIDGVDDYGIVLLISQDSASDKLIAALRLYVRHTDGSVRCKSDLSLTVAEAQMDRFSSPALADFIVSAIANVSTNPLMDTMLESRGFISELEQMAAAGRATF